MKTPHAPLRPVPHKTALLVGLSLASLGFCGCSSLETSAPPSAPPAELRSLAIFDGTTGVRTSWDELQERMDKADAIVIGELHGHPVGLPFVAELFEESLQRNPDAALALEFVTRDWQYLLDAYLADLIDFDDLEQTMEGARGSTVTPHGPMIQVAHDAGRPVYAANAPRVYTSTARKQGYPALAQLSAEQRRLFDVPPVMPSGGYKDRFFSFMGYEVDVQDSSASPEDSQESTPEIVARKLPTKSMEAVFRSQSLWDGTMSRTASNAMNEGNRPVFLVVGQFHCDKDGGTLQLLRHAQPGADLLVISVASTWSETLLEEDRSRADYIVYVGPFPDEE